MKKKMKKIFSKLTVLVLLVAMLIPYTSIPKVEAASDWECSEENTEYHTNYYFFAQAEHPRTWASYLANEDNNVSTTYFTSFLYNFPIDGSTIEIDSSGFVSLKGSGGANSKGTTSSWSLERYYNELLKMYEGGDSYDYLEEESLYKQYSYSVEGAGTKSDKIVSYFIHGPWGFAGLNEDLTTADMPIKNKSGIININSYEDANGDASVDDIIDDLVDATILPEDNSITRLNVSMVRDVMNENSKEAVENAIKTFSNSKGATTTGIDVTDDTKEPVIYLYIKRAYETEEFFTFNQLRKQSGGLYVEYDGTTSIEDIEPDKVLFFPTTEESCTDCTDKSYVTQGGTDGTKVSEATAVKLVAENDDGDDVASHWFISPSLFQISYKVCKTSGGDPETEVSVTYHKNTDDTVENMPSKNPEIITKGSAYTISDKEPTRSGYTFQGWATNDKCTGTKHGPETKYTDSLNENANLFACWGDTSEGDQEDTGVLTYAGLFTGIIALAGGSYYLIKKKNLFKRI